MQARIILSLLLIALYLFSATLNLLNLNRAEREEIQQQAAAMRKRKTFQRTEFLGDPAFDHIIAMHDRYRSEFYRWRSLFSQHASQLAQLVKTFPGSEQLSEEELGQKFFNGTSVPANVGDVFQPWTDRWQGMWSNGKMQYHVWDSTRLIDDRMIQAVSLSEYALVPVHEAGKAARFSWSDLAVNILSPETGVTGWVSKYQSGRWELPHVGYSINDTTLIWICQIKSPDHLFVADSLWFVFLEIVRSSGENKEYRIYGLSVIVTDRFVARIDQRGRHRGIYRSAADALPRLARQETEGGRDGT